MHTYHIISLNWRQMIFLQCFTHNLLLKGFKVLIWRFRLPLTRRLHHKCHEMLKWHVLSGDSCRFCHLRRNGSAPLVQSFSCQSGAPCCPTVHQTMEHCGRADPDEDCRSTAVQILGVQIQILVLFYRNRWCSRCRNNTGYMWSDEEAATFLQIHTKRHAIFDVGKKP